MAARVRGARAAGRAGRRGAGVVARGTDREIQIIPSVLPADWANMGQCVKDLEAAVREPPAPPPRPPPRGRFRPPAPARPAGREGLPASAAQCDPPHPPGPAATPARARGVGRWDGLQGERLQRD